MKGNPLLEDRNPARTKRLILGAIMVFCITFTVMLVGKYPLMKTNIDLYYAIQALEEGDEVVFNDVVPFDWDSVYTFAPYTEPEIMAETMGVTVKNLQQTLNEGMVQYYFIHQEKLVCAIYGYPNANGFVLEWEGSPLRYSDDARFSVAVEDWRILTQID